MIDKMTKAKLVKEAAYWEKMKKALKDGPGKVCQK
jgi:hypothetical protein